jgi:hypothetical protein
MQHSSFGGTRRNQLPDVRARQAYLALLGLDPFAIDAKFIQQNQIWDLG